MALLYAIGKILIGVVAYRSFLLLLLIYCGTCSVNGQSSIRGTVTDKSGRPIKDAHLVVRAQAEGDILAFNITASDGRYLLELPDRPDTMWLYVSHLAYSSQEKMLRDRLDTIDWQLVARVYELPEMEVRQETVIRRGDTLVFDVNQLRESQDENIEQVLARIPGVTVEPSGRILYQDLPISKFYIEGLDLLEGRYALATRNLNIAAIRDVEILERHQPIRALDSLLNPPNAAINLRLKSRIVLTGSSEIGGGIAPELYQLRGTLFGFQKQQQFNVIGAANNVGEPQRSNFRDLYAKTTFEHPLVRPTLPLVPLEAATKNILDNREATGGLIQLRKFGQYGQLKSQFYGTTDRVQYRGRREILLRSPETTVGFNEALDAEEDIGELTGVLAYEINRPRLFTKASVEVTTGKESTLADNLINEQLSEEDFTRNSIRAKGRLNSLIRRGKRAYQLWSRFSYRENDFNLGLTPLQLITADTAVQRIGQARQSARQRVFRSDTYTNYIFRRKLLTAQFRGGFATESRTIESNLSQLTTTGENSSLGPFFENETRQSTWKYYLENALIWKKEMVRWEFTLPLGWHHVTLTSALTEIPETSRNLLVLEPNLAYTLELPNKQIFAATFGFRRDYDQEQLFFNNYLLRVNRQFERQAFDVNQRSRYRVGLRLRGQEFKTGIYYNTYLTLSSTTADLLATTVFDRQGQASIIASVRNSRQRAGWENQFEALLWQSIQLKILANYAFSTIPRQLNGDELRINSHYGSISPYLSYTFGDAVLSWRLRLNYSNNNLTETAVWQSRMQWVYFHELSKKWGKVNISLEHNRTRIGPRKVNNQLLNLWYKIHIRAWKTDLSVHLNNLTDVPDFITFTQTGFYEELQFFRLRPRQILLTLTRKF